MAANKILDMLLDYYRINILRDEFSIAMRRWLQDEGDSTLRLQYPLTSESIVFDVGGFKGDWSDHIIKRYDPFIYIFEPVPVYFKDIERRFSFNPKINIFNFGLSDKDFMGEMFVNEDGSSMYYQVESNAVARFRDVYSFIEENKINNIDIMKINIEGGEYSLLQRMIEKEITGICNNIQVQFHNCFQNAPEMRMNIREVLNKTHFLTYDYYFVWENWEKRR